MTFAWVMPIWSKFSAFLRVPSGERSPCRSLFAGELLVEARAVFIEKEENARVSKLPGTIVDMTGVDATEHGEPSEEAIVLEA